MSRVVPHDHEDFSGVGPNEWDTPSRKDAYRYSIHNGTRKPVEPRESWQKEEYERVMGQEPPNLSLPQFEYNPRTKAGKALLEELQNG